MFPAKSKTTEAPRRNSSLASGPIRLRHFEDALPKSSSDRTSKPSVSIHSSSHITTAGRVRPNSRASVVFPDQRPYPTRGRLLVFNGRANGKPALFAHIYTTKPFASSFVVTFALKHINQGPYGTELQASLPQALGDWGFVDRIKLTLRRKYQYKGRELSYFNAACPAPPGAVTASFPLATAKLDFAGGEAIGATVTKACRVSE